MKDPALAATSTTFFSARPFGERYGELGPAMVRGAVLDRSAFVDVPFDVERD